MTTFTHLPLHELPEAGPAGSLPLMLLTSALALSLAAFTLADLLAVHTAPAASQPRLPVAASTLALDTSVPAARADSTAVQEPLPPTF